MLKEELEVLIDAIFRHMDLPQITLNQVRISIHYFLLMV